MRIRRHVVPVVVGAVVGAFSWGALSVQAGADTSGSFGAYMLKASASGYRHILGGQIDSTVPDAATTFETGNIGYGRASIAWPGALLGNAGDLFIILGGGQLPPDAQNGVRTFNDPVRAEARAPSGPPQASFDQVPGVAMKATADATTATAHSSAQQSSVPGAVDMGSATADSRSALGAGQVVSEASSRVSDISFGEVLHIDSITSSARATSDAVTATGAATTTVNGVTVAGQPATIDEHGLQLGTSKTPLNEAANQAAKQALEQAGIEVVVSQPVITTEGASSSASAGSVLISFGDGQAAFVFGGATAAATASPAFDEAGTPVDGGTTSVDSGDGGLGLGPTQDLAGSGPAGVAAPAGAGTQPRRLDTTLTSSLGKANPVWLVLVAAFLGWLTAAALRRLGTGILELGPACDEGDEP